MNRVSGRLVGDYGRFWPADWSAMTVAWMAGWSVMRGDGLIGLVGDEEQWVMGDGWPADRLQG